MRAGESEKVAAPAGEDLGSEAFEAIRDLRPFLTLTAHTVRR